MSTLFDFEGYKPKNKSVLALMEDYNKQYATLFGKVKKDWLPAMRDFLRDQTGLTLHRRNTGIKIIKDSNLTFEFKPDRDSSFLKLIDEQFGDLNFNEFIAFKKLHYELNNCNNLVFETEENFPFSEYRSMQIFLISYFKRYKIEDLITGLFKNTRSADIFGCYFSDYNRIEIYYIPLILFAKLSNVSLEHLITTTLVHELAHAYHHSGKDKDNVMWGNYQSAELKIKEGLAEYCSWLFVQEYKRNYPEMETAYESMFECLGGDYKIFKEWQKEYSKEVIKTTLLTARKRNIRKYEDFINLMKSFRAFRENK